MKDIVLAFDTSNYTTSCAWFDGERGENSGMLLDVKQGELGLRQSEALFSHVKRLPGIVEKLGPAGRIMAVGASTKPRETEDSYMPCFLAGSSMAQTISTLMQIPFFAWSHQQGHIAAAAWSSGHPELMEQAHLAWHLSGGTTELLYVEPSGHAVVCQRIGGTSDLAAGQVIDRAGVLLGLQFPAGKALDGLAAQAVQRKTYMPKVDDLTFSISGIEHKMKQMHASGASPEEIAYFTIASVIEAVQKVTENARRQYGALPVLYSGGVASNTLLRSMTPDGYFAQPRYSTDNAMGCAILTYRAVNANG